MEVATPAPFCNSDSGRAHPNADSGLGSRHSRTIWPSNTWPYRPKREYRFPEALTGSRRVPQAPIGSKRTPQVPTGSRRLPPRPECSAPRSPHRLEKAPRGSPRLQKARGFADPNVNTEYHPRVEGVGVRGLAIAGRPMEQPGTIGLTQQPATPPLLGGRLTLNPERRIVGGGGVGGKWIV